MAVYLQRAYYCADATAFTSATEAEIYMQLVSSSMLFDLTAMQEMAWRQEISIMRGAMMELGRGGIALEYTIPRMGRRIDCVIVFDGAVFPIEFKVGESTYPRAAIDQVVDYALDLKNFHAASHALPIFPTLVCTEAPCVDSSPTMRGGISSPLLCGRDDIARTIRRAAAIAGGGSAIDFHAWLASPYKPTPTIIEAAQALYAGHSVQEISHRESDVTDIEATTSRINGIIDESRRSGHKSICFVTGVLGAGKTLVGLSIANARHCFDHASEEHAVFLSGNGPLVAVLQEALTRDRYESADRDRRLTKSAIKRETESFIQIIHKFRDESLIVDHRPPIDRIAIFDESQRAWNEDKLSRFMREKKGVANFDMSEPECLIEYMDRHDGWAAIVCLVGGGQEIHEGEAGIGEWFRALTEHFPGWRVFCSNRMAGDEYVGADAIAELARAMSVTISPELHLSVSMRSFRSESVSAFAKALIDGDAAAASALYEVISAPDAVSGDSRYPIVMTRDLASARAWVKRMSRGTERYGLIASSGAKRLRADGVDVSIDLNVEKWFLNGPDDVNSSYFMEVAATEFQIQGLEIDWAVVAWEADYRYVGGAFTHNSFSGSSWRTIRSRPEQEYLKNSYRVLLTRARQGYVIYVPSGSAQDDTRRPEFYDGLYGYLRGLRLLCRHDIRLIYAAVADVLGGELDDHSTSELPSSRCFLLNGVVVDMRSISALSWPISMPMNARSSWVSVSRAAWSVPRICARIFSDMASPAASSAAELMRKPVDSRVMALDSASFVDAKAL